MLGLFKGRKLWVLIKISLLSTWLFLYLIFGDVLVYIYIYIYSSCNPEKQLMRENFGNRFQGQPKK
jgi:hypothetical protein